MEGGLKDESKMKRVLGDSSCDGEVIGFRCVELEGWIVLRT